MVEVLLLLITVLIIYSLNLSYSISKKIKKGSNINSIDKYFVTAFCSFIFLFTLSLGTAEGTAIYWDKLPIGIGFIFFYFHFLVFIYQWKLIWYSKPDNE